MLHNTAANGLIGRRSLTAPTAPTADHRTDKNPSELEKPTDLRIDMNIKHAVFGYGR